MNLAINVPEIPQPDKLASPTAAATLLRGLGELRAERDLALSHGHYRYVATLEDLIAQAWRTWRQVVRVEAQWTRFEGGARYGDSA